jgi:hypothetical protein
MLPGGKFSDSLGCTARAKTLTAVFSAEADIHMKMHKTIQLSANGSRPLL